MVFLRCLNIYGSYLATPVVSSLWFEAVCFQSSIPSFSTLFYYIVHFFVLVRYVQDVRIGRVLHSAEKWGCYRIYLILL